jgi:hypothetical protein
MRLLDLPVPSVTSVIATGVEPSFDLAPKNPLMYVPSTFGCRMWL